MVEKQSTKIWLVRPPKTYRGVPFYCENSKIRFPETMEYPCWVWVTMYYQAIVPAEKLIYLKGPCCLFVCFMYQPQTGSFSPVFDTFDEYLQTKLEGKGHIEDWCALIGCMSIHSANSFLDSYNAF